MTTNRAAENAPVVLLGATGRLGGMLRGFWPESADLICQSRETKAGFLGVDPLADPETLKKVSQGARAILCLSGVTPARAARTGASLSLNTDLALAALGAAVAAKVPRLFVASSAAVYGATPGIHAETDACVPVSPYGAAKLAMERAVLAAASGSPVNVTVLRIGNVAGADAILGGWGPGMQIDLFADRRTPRRSYIGPVTFARVIHALSRAVTLPDILNIAAPGTVEMGALLDAAGLAWVPRPAVAGAIEAVELATRPLEELVAIPASASLVKTMVAEWRELEQLP